MCSQVFIAGCGPVGLCLAIDLAMRGITVTIVDTRHAREIPTVRCNHVSSRTMEAFRRMGIASRVRDAGLPDAYPNDIVFRPVATHEEFARIRIPGGLRPSRPIAVIRSFSSRCSSTMLPP
jgi:2-polyprenyl-6-methoxyphenol hydroxylase-like FAD-dependent oxidoreductase